MNESHLKLTCNKLHLGSPIDTPTSIYGKSYAPEAAKAVLEYAFNTLNLKEVVSFTSIGNQKSIRVMEKIGLKHDPKDDFYHPKLDKDHPLALNVLYKLSKEDLNKNYEH